MRAMFSRISRVCVAGHDEPTVQQGAKGIYFPLAKVVRGYDPLDMVSLDP